ncbi:MAG: DUF736 family protein [Micropepsaceae bacterium]
MAVIGTFAATKDGGWSGVIRTLSLDVKVRFVPNDKRDQDAAPDFRVFAGEFEIGAAWRKVSAKDDQKEYLSVRLEDPMLPHALTAALFAIAGGREAQLVWTATRRVEVVS